MEMYKGSDRLMTETYMMPGTGLNPQLASTPPLEDIDYMGNETAPELVLDQGLYYPAAANYYGYYCTGFESPSELDDHNMFFGLDGQDLQSGLQTDGTPYVYYSPSYEYAQSPYNPYNPYIPGAVVGFDNSFIGTQPYATSSLYQQPVSPPAYFPVVVHSNSDIAPNNYSGHLTLSNGASVTNRANGATVKHTPLVASTSAHANLPNFGSGFPTSFSSQSSSRPPQSLPKLAEGLLSTATHSKQSSSHGGTTSGRSHQTPQHESRSSGSVPATHHISNGPDPSIDNPFKGTMLGGNGLRNIGSISRVWAASDKLSPGIQFNGPLTNGDRNSRMLYDQNRAPRTNRSKFQRPSMITVRAYKNKAGAGDVQGNIIIQADQYNRDDFALDYPEAKFFVIKSYSEDDVHKSIKYNIWSSTPNGNKKLDAAYDEAQRISGKPRRCPVFLFFSVNASGHFCGVAEMVGPVDFSKDMDFWQQDKWIGSFPVKWHIIKDVPNTSLRHIILENNENRPVTSSRDTQEVPYLPGLSMLHIFKNLSLGTSLLDDFMFYEERQKIMEEERSRLPRRGYMSFALASSVPSHRPSDSVDLGPAVSENQLNGAIDGDEDELHGAVVHESHESHYDGDQQNGIVDLPQKIEKLDLAAVQTSKEGGEQPGVLVKDNGVVLDSAIKQLSVVDEKGPTLPTDNSPKTDEKSTELGDPKKPISPKLHFRVDKKDRGPEPGSTNCIASAFQIGSIPFYPKGVKTNSSVPGPRGGSNSADVVTVGSMRIIVNKDGQSSLIDKS